jgi:hypothetical protein
MQYGYRSKYSLTLPSPRNEILEQVPTFLSAIRGASANILPVTTKTEKEVPGQSGLAGTSQIRESQAAGSRQPIGSGQDRSGQIEGRQIRERPLGDGQARGALVAGGHAGGAQVAGGHAGGALVAGGHAGGALVAGGHAGGALVAGGHAGGALVDDGSGQVGGVQGGGVTLKLGCRLCEQFGQPAAIVMSHEGGHILCPTRISHSVVPPPQSMQQEQASNLHTADHRPEENNNTREIVQV